MRFIKRITRMDLFVLGIFVFMWCVAPDVQVFAATIGERITSIGNEFSQTKSAFLTLALIIGIIMSIVGLMKFLKASRGGEGGIGEGIKYLAVGVALIALSTVIKLTSTTLTGTEASF